MKLEKIDSCRWRLRRQGKMRVDGTVYASAGMVAALEADKVLEQVSNVACLPGIAGRSMAMPDAHWGYGFPIGGVAAFRADEGVISPGGVGYDISCGVRLLRSSLKTSECGDRLPRLMDALFSAVPSGIGKSGGVSVGDAEMARVLTGGARWAVEAGFGQPQDLEACEDMGAMSGALPEKVSARALERGEAQLGTLGSGNHFIEVQEVDEVYDEKAAFCFGLFKGQVVVLVHTGSRGLGYQVCDDYISVMMRASQKYGIALPDRQLACAPLASLEGKDYFAAMACAANYAKANRQAITHLIRQAFGRIFGGEFLEVVYDVSHNIAKMETHEVDGMVKLLCVHRKGATRAFPAGHDELPSRYKAVGQPVLVPGSMGTYSYVLSGTPHAMAETFGSVCHGAGRVWSRSKASKNIDSSNLRHELEGRGISVRTGSMKGLAEEAPAAYKDVCEVVSVCEIAGLASKVARMRPLGVVKG